eukprot:4956242-Pyramimonas_sp.AAC.1
MPIAKVQLPPLSGGPPFGRSWAAGRLSFASLLSVVATDVSKQLSCPVGGPPLRPLAAGCHA